MDDEESTGTYLLLALRFLEMVPRAGVGPRMAAKIEPLEQGIRQLVMDLPGMRRAVAMSRENRSGAPEPGAGAGPEGSAEGETDDPEARRAELAATRAYLEWATAEEPLHGKFLTYVLSAVDYLESSLEHGTGDRRREEVCWEALHDALAVADSDRFPEWPVPLVDLDEEDGELLERVELYRRLLSAGPAPESGTDDLAWMLAMLCEPLEFLLLDRYTSGRETLLALFGGLDDDVRLDAEALAEEEGVDGWWDEEPCYARDPATAPAAFLGRQPAAVRREEAAAVRGFLAGVEPEPGDQAAFHAACLALADRLERDLAAGEVDPDWEALLWRLLRALLSLADPLWLAAHPLARGALVESERRRVARLGSHCAAARPGQEGEAASRARGMIVGVATSALRLYALGRCSSGVRDWEEAREAFLRYVNRGRG